MNEPNGLWRLEMAKSRRGPFTIRLRGETHTLVDPTVLPFHFVAALLQLDALPGLPNMKLWQRESVMRRWRAHYDLPDWPTTNRLLYLVDRYYDDLETDLRIYSQVDLGQAWHERRWRFLVAAIDRLPGHSYYAEAVSQDEEHAKLLAASRVEGDAPSGPAAPPLRIWTPEVQLMTRIFDQMRRMEHTMVSLKVGSSKAGKVPEGSPTPLSLVAKRAEHHMRMTKHKALAARMLPHKK